MKGERISGSRLAFWTVIASFILSGCTVRPPVHPDLATRLPNIHTVAISVPYLERYVQSYHLSHTKRYFMTGAAVTNIATAVRDQFGQSGIFLMREMDLNESSFAPRMPPWCSVRNSEAAGYGPTLPDIQFKPKAFSSPPPEIGADAALFIFGWEMTSTSGAIYKKTGPLALWLLPIEAIFDTFSDRPDSMLLDDFSRRRICLGMSLIDTHTGEVLWSTIQMDYGFGTLEDAKTAGDLVTKAYSNFNNFRRIKSNSHGHAVMW
jgi:hypothetical protein